MKQSTLNGCPGIAPFGMSTASFCTYPWTDFSHFSLARRFCLDEQSPANRATLQAADDGNTTEKPPGTIAAELTHFQGLLSLRTFFDNKGMLVDIAVSVSHPVLAVSDGQYQLRIHVSCLVFSRAPWSLLVNNSKHCLQPLKSLLIDKVGSRLSLTDVKELDSLNFAGLRDQLLAEGPLDVAWIKKASWGLRWAFSVVLHDLLMYRP